MSSEVERLVSRLEECSRLYYENGTSPMTDEEYDAAVAYLQKIDPSNEFLKKIGPTPAATSKLYHFGNPMGTLEKIRDRDKLSKWIEEVAAESGCKEFIISPKYDGSSCSLIYKNGSLIAASTRGSGYVGEDITENVKLISNIPQKISETRDFEVRGELIIPLEESKFFAANGYTALRNAVPGIIRSKTPEKSIISKIHFVAHGAFINDPEINASQNSIREFLSSQDFEIEEFYWAMKPEAIQDEMDHIYQNFKKYELDGIVIKSNSVYSQENWLTPTRWVAFKYDSKIKDSILRSIRWQVGGTGKMIPIAEFDPVEFQGAQCSNATIGSYNKIKELKKNGLKIGSMIGVKRLNDIIPHVSTFDPETGDTEIEIPEICPCCMNKLSVVGAHIFCTNDHCKDVLKVKISDYITGLGFKGIGKGIISKLVDAELITSVSQMYLGFDYSVKGVNMKGYGQSVADKFNDLLHKKVSLQTFLSAYPIEDAGKKVWDKIFADLDYNEIYDWVTGLMASPPRNIKGVSNNKIDDITEQLNKHSADFNACLEIVLNHGQAAFIPCNNPDDLDQ